jgi:hypothetical protein
MNMTEPEQDRDQTAVDDVRRVREQIARQHGGNLREHIEETNRVTEQLAKELGIRTVSPRKTSPRRSGTQG